MDNQKNRSGFLIALIFIFIIAGAAFTAPVSAQEQGGFIEVGTSPIADFTADVTFGKAPLTVSFADRTDGSLPISYFWDFGDATESSERHPVHTFTDPGIYTVTLTTVNEYGTDEKRMTAYITVGAAPVPDFTAFRTTGTVPLTVSFTDMSSGSEPLTFGWDFGDGSVSAIENPTHTYPDPGTYNVTLTVTNAYGKDSVIMIGYVHAGLQPVAEFAAEPAMGAVPLTVSFTELSEGSVTSWSWDFGDGSASEIENPTHTYESAGVFDVTLTVANKFGTAEETKAALITAGNSPKAAFTADVQKGAAPLNVQFTDLSTGEPTSWKWDFGDGGISELQNPSHIYRTEGLFNVMLTVENEFGTDTVTVSSSGAMMMTGTATETPAPTATEAVVEAPEQYGVGDYAIFIGAAVIICIVLAGYVTFLGRKKRSK